MNCRPKRQNQLGDDVAAPVRKIEHIIEGQTTPEDELEVLKILGDVGRSRLNYILSHVDLSTLLGDIHGFVFATYRPKLLTLLSKTRLKEITAENRSLMIVAMIPRCARNTGEQLGIGRILTGTAGKKLFALKQSLDSQGGGLYNLVFQHLSNTAVRRSVLRHFRKQGSKVKKGALGHKVLSMIDDTLFQASGGSRDNFRGVIGGKRKLSSGSENPSQNDQSNNKKRAGLKYPPLTVFPGALQFLRELDENVVFISPEVDANLAGRRKYLDHIFTRYNLHKPLILTPVNTVYNAAKGGYDSAQGMGGFSEGPVKRLLSILARYGDIYPECPIVLVATSTGIGVQFVQAATDTLENVKGAYIHDGAEANGIRPLIAERDRTLYFQNGIIVFDTYISASAESYEEGVITAGGMARVAQAAIQDFYRTRFTSHRHMRVRRAELVRDLTLMNKKLAADHKINWQDVQSAVMDDISDYSDYDSDDSDDDSEYSSDVSDSSSEDSTEYSGNDEDSFDSDDDEVASGSEGSESESVSASESSEESSDDEPQQRRRRR